MSVLSWTPSRALGLPLAALAAAVPAFYAMEYTRTPVITAAAAFAANLCCSLLLMGPVTSTGQSYIANAIAAVTQTISVLNLRHAGLALSTSVAATVNLILLAVFLRRRLGALGAAEVVPSFVRSLVAALAMIPAVRYVAGLTVWAQRGELLQHVAVLALAIGVGVAVFLAGALLLGGDEIQAVTRALRERLTRRPVSDQSAP